MLFIIAAILVAAFVGTFIRITVENNLNKAYDRHVAKKAQHRLNNK